MNYREEYIEQVKDCDKYYECKDCSKCRYNMTTGEYYCLRSYSNVSIESSACDDFELDE